MIKVCPRCGAVHDGHRWIPEPSEELKKAVGGQEHQVQLCPGDLRLENKQIQGVVALSGAFLERHREEIVNLVNRVAREGRKRNAAARIFGVRNDGDTIIIETTDAHLAERIGKGVQRAFKGDLEMKWQYKDEFARVYWRRD